MLQLIVQCSSRIAENVLDVLHREGAIGFGNLGRGQAFGKQAQDVIYFAHFTLFLLLHHITRREYTKIPNHNQAPIATLPTTSVTQAIHFLPPHRNLLSLRACWHRSCICRHWQRKELHDGTEDLTSRSPHRRRAFGVATLRSHLKTRFWVRVV